MSLWQSGDLVLTMDGLSGDRQAQLVAWDSSGLFRGNALLAPPLNAATSNAPVLPAFKFDNSYFYGFLEVGVPTDFDNKMVFGNGNEGDLDWDFTRSLGQGVGQAFDSLGNRYVGDYDGTIDSILKITPEGLEQRFLVDVTDPNIDAVGAAVNRLHVDSGGTRAYWNSAPINPSSTSTLVGFNRYDLTNGWTLPFYDLTTIIPTASVLSDFAVGPSTGRIYLSYEGLNGFPFIAVIDPDNLEILNIYPPGNNKCIIHMIAINCDETMMAAIHSDTGINDIEVFDPFTGDPFFLIDYASDSGRSIIRGMAWAKCPAVAGRFFGFVTLIGAT